MKRSELKLEWVGTLSLDDDTGFWQIEYDGGTYLVGRSGWDHYSRAGFPVKGAQATYSEAVLVRDGEFTNLDDAMDHVASQISKERESK